jgi:hypothetical protein
MAKKSRDDSRLSLTSANVGDMVQKQSGKAEQNGRHIRLHLSAEGRGHCRSWDYSYQFGLDTICLKEHCELTAARNSAVSHNRQIAVVKLTTQHNEVHKYLDKLSEVILPRGTSRRQEQWPVPRREEPKCQAGASDTEMPSAARSASTSSGLTSVLWLWKIGLSQKERRESLRLCTLT